MGSGVHDDGPSTGPGARTVRPDRWLGQTGCAVGPFTDRKAAERFAGLGVDFGQYTAYRQNVTQRGGDWYVEVTKTAAPR